MSGLAASLWEAAVAGYLHLVKTDENCVLRTSALVVDVDVINPFTFKADSPDPSDFLLLLNG